MHGKVGWVGGARSPSGSTNQGLPCGPPRGLGQLRQKAPPSAASLSHQPHSPPPGTGAPPAIRHIRADPAVRAATHLLHRAARNRAPMSRPPHPTNPHRPLTRRPHRHGCSHAGHDLVTFSSHLPPLHHPSLYLSPYWSSRCLPGSAAAGYIKPPPAGLAAAANPRSVNLNPPTAPRSYPDLPDPFSANCSVGDGQHGGGAAGAGAAGQRQRRAEDAPLRGGAQEPAQERRPLPVHPGHERVPAGAREHEGAPRDHRQAPLEPDDNVGGRGAVPQHAHQAHRRQEDHGDRRLHRLLPPRHRARPPRGRHDLGHGHQPRELRARPALHREGRRRPQDRLPRGPRAPRPRRPHRRREEPRHLRLRLRGRRQGQLPQLPRAAAQARQARRPYRLRQHAVERLRRAPRRRAHAQVHPLLPRLRARAQQGARRRRARRDLPAPRRRRRHPLPPRQVSVARPGCHPPPATAPTAAAARLQS